MSTLSQRAAASTERQSLEYFEFAGLFGRISKGIELENDGPTIITGANGTGKSTILRLVNAAANGSVMTLASAPLDYLRLAFDRGPDFVLERSSDGVTVVWGEERSTLATNDRFAHLPSWAADALEARDFDLSALAAELSDVASSLSVPFEEYREVRNILMHAGDGSGPLLRKPDWFDEFALGFPVLFVADQRLITEPASKGRPSNRQSRLAVEAASSDIANRLRAADSDYARSAQVVDRQLAEALIRRMGEGYDDVPLTEIQTLIERVDERRSVLRNVGLLDESSSVGVSVDVTQLHDSAVRRVVQVVFESTLRKFEVLDDLERRLTTFKRFLDGRLDPKKLELDRQSGMQFDVTGARTVRPRQLSSGEQQITVLAYEILFRTRPSTLVIVDEPEISLHVTWQDSLVRDLQRMGQASDVKFLLATHSPMILAGHPELERSLSAEEE